VSVCPNHQTLRNTPLQSRIDIASLTSFGYELNLNVFSKNEKIQIKKANERYLKNAHIILNGDLFRLTSPFNSNTFTWLIVSKDKREAVFCHFYKLAEPNPIIYRIKLNGLDTDKIYRINELSLELSGKTLINAGIPIIPDSVDFTTMYYTITAVN